MMCQRRSLSFAFVRAIAFLSISANAVASTTLDSMLDKFDTVTAETRAAEYLPTSVALDRALTAAMKDRAALCNFQYLKSIGWRVIESQTGDVEIIDGAPCSRATVEKSQLAGDMTIALPKNPKPADFETVIRYLPQLMKSDPTVCGYKLRIAVAAKTAIDKLKANDQYGFIVTSAAQFFEQVGAGRTPIGFVDLGVGGGRKMGWEPLSFKYIWGSTAIKPRKSNWDAIESFYTMPVRSECAAGLQLAEYAVQKELYGKADFDLAFKNEEIVLATWDIITDSQSATWGKGAGRRVSDRSGSKAALLGGAALIGRVGYFGNVLGEAYLDNKPNRGENLIIAGITPDASLAFARAGGVEPFNQMLREAWELRNANTKLDPTRDKALIAKNEARVEEILKDPFLSGVRTHTHPFAEYYSFSQLFEHVYSANPRTPYKLWFYADTVNYGLFDRHQKYLVGKCVSSASN